MGSFELIINFNEQKIFQRGKIISKKVESKEIVRDKNKHNRGNKILKNNEFISKKADHVFNVEIIPNSVYDNINVIIDKYKHK